MRSRRPRRLPRIAHPESAIREYRRFCNMYCNTYCKLLREGLAEVVPRLRDVAADEMPEGTLPRYDSARMDENIEAKLKRLFDSISHQLSLDFTYDKMFNATRAMINQVNKHSKKSVAKQLNVGFTNSQAIPEFELFMKDNKLNAYFQNVIDENIGLIKSIKTGKEDLFKNQLVSLITGDATHGQIQAAISKYIDPLKGRAATIAEDQVGKLNGTLSQYRQQQLGGKRYIWRNSKDARVAGNPTGLYPHAHPSHWKREGVTYYWSKPPEGGHPGQRVKCRCYAEFVLDDVLD